MRTMVMVREYLYEDIQEVMRAAFEETTTFKDAKEEYDFYYYLFNNTWDCSQIKYKYLLTEELKKEDNEQWKKDFLKELYEFLCPEEFKRLEKKRDGELPDIGEIRPVLEETITSAFSQDFREVPAPSWIGDLHPVEEVPIRIRIGE